VDSQKIAFIAQIAAISAVYGGMNMLKTSMTDLGIISEEQAKTFQKINATVGLVLGTFQLVRGAVEIVNTLKTAEIGLALVESYRAVLNNPAKIALVGAGLAATAGVGGYLVGQNNANKSNTVNNKSSTTNNNTINFFRSSATSFNKFGC